MGRLTWVGVAAVVVLPSIALGAGTGVPTGRLVFATAGDETDRLEIAVANPDGTGFRKITRHPLGGFALWWGAPDRIILVTSDSFTGRVMYWRMRADGSRRQRLPGSETDTVSPSGRKVAIERARRITIVDARGRVRNSTRIRYGAQGYSEDIFWSADERYIAINVITETERTEYARIFVARADRNGVARSVTRRGRTETLLGWSSAGHTLLVQGENAVYTKTLSGRRGPTIMRRLPPPWRFSWTQDRSRIAYVGRRGGVYSIGIDGRNHRRIARTARNVDLVDIEWAPNGKSLALADGGRLYIIEGNRRRRVAAKLGAILSASWSPSGTRLVFTARGQIWTIKRDGSGLRALTAPTVWDDSPRLSPDGSRVAFLRGSPGLNDPRANSVYVVGVNGRGLRRLGRGYGPEWSPDGRHVAFVDDAASRDPPELDRLRAGAIVVADAEAGTRRTIAVGTAPAWSPDGRSFAFLRHRFVFDDCRPGKRSWYVSGSTLYTVGADGQGEGAVVTSDRGCEFSFDRPAWSPDGRTIALVDSDAYEGRRVLALVDAATGALQRFEGVPTSELAWSPDGGHLAVSNGSIGTVRPDGSGYAVVAPGRLDFDFSNPVWSPDGSSLGAIGCLYPAGTDSRSCDVYVMSADGSNRGQVTRTRGVEGALNWGVATAR